MRVSSTLMTSVSAVALLAAVAPAGAQPAEQAGVAAAAQTITRGILPVTGERTLEVGLDVFRFEQIVTNATGTAQLLFLDESALTVRPNSTVIIDEFVYDPTTNTGQLVLQTAGGAFRFFGGELSSQGRVTFDTPVGTIGIRGSVLDLTVTPDGVEAECLTGEELTVEPDALPAPGTEDGAPPVFNFFCPETVFVGADGTILQGGLLEPAAGPGDGDGGGGFTPFDPPDQGFVPPYERENDPPDFTPPAGNQPPPDGGTPPPDGGTPPPDGGTPPPDGGTPPPDDGEPPPGDFEFTGLGWSGGLGVPGGFGVEGPILNESQAPNSFGLNVSQSPDTADVQMDFDHYDDYGGELPGNTEDFRDYEEAGPPTFPNSFSVPIFSPGALSESHHGQLSTHDRPLEDTDPSGPGPLNWQKFDESAGNGVPDDFNLGFEDDSPMSWGHWAAPVAAGDPENPYDSDATLYDQGFWVAGPDIRSGADVRAIDSTMNLSHTGQVIGIFSGPSGSDARIDSSTFSMSYDPASESGGMSIGTPANPLDGFVYPDIRLSDAFASGQPFVFLGSGAATAVEGPSPNITVGGSFYGPEFGTTAGGFVVEGESGYDGGGVFGGTGGLIPAPSE